MKKSKDHFEPFYCYICGNKKQPLMDVDDGDVRTNCFFFNIGGFNWIVCRKCFETLSELRK